MKANNDLIADSLETLRDRPRPTYKFYMTSEEEETASVNDKMDTIMKCYKEFGKYENNLDVLKCVIELIEGKPLSQNVKADSVRAKINTLIQERTKDFLKTITNTYLQEIVLIKKAVLAGLILKNGDYYYLINHPIASFDERCSMIKKSVEGINKIYPKSVFVEDVEGSLMPPYYSYKTLDVLYEKYDGDKNDIYIIGGADVINSVSGWLNFEKSIKNKFKFIGFTRGNEKITNIVRKIIKSIKID